MRSRRAVRGLTVQAIAGSHVVLLGFDLDLRLCPGLLGFAIHRTDHVEDEAYWLEGLKTFAETDPKRPAGTQYATNQHPIQGFTWSDFTAKPGYRYTYRIEALTGTPSALTTFRRVSVEVKTECEATGDHDVFFNRGAAASQEFARRFGQMASLESAPPDDPRWAWLSRGAEEAMLAFVARATDRHFALRVSAYEFRLPSLARALDAARLRGVDVQVLYDANANPPDTAGAVFPRDVNRTTARAAGIESLVRDRVTRSDVTRPPIAHHKFIVLVRDEQPEAVLTGSTNFSLGGVFGQANVVHIVEMRSVAKSYLECWHLIAANPDHQMLRTELTRRNALQVDLSVGAPLPLRRAGTRAVFSPQRDRAALDGYARLAAHADGALFMTFAFGMNEEFRQAYRSGKAALRYALLDKLIASGTAAARRQAAEAEMVALRRMPANRFAVGNRLSTNRFDRWVQEKLTGLNQHVQYIHTKFMLIDPLGRDPIVITGSANFSEASTTANDENMLVIRGNARVADIYVGEYMRLWNHYAFREWAADRGGAVQDSFRHLDVADQWWREYFRDSARSRQRKYFSGAPR
ncbi:MAG: hypothetical protein H7125_14685 [Proteobacteria bacterium]|nr:hypothetical protein [Burkholderiales bacterium]